MGSEASVPERSAGGAPLNAAYAAQSLPITQNEAALLTPTGKSCTFRDTGDLAYRLQQLLFINYTVQVLSKELWKDAPLINFPQLIQEAMTYKDVDGNPDPRFAWRMLSEDTVAFPAQETAVNRFKEFEQYLSKKAGAPTSEMKKDLDFFMVIFIRLRDKLVDTLAASCQMSGGAIARGV